MKNAEVLIFNSHKNNEDLETNCEDLKSIMSFMMGRMSERKMPHLFSHNTC